MSLDLDRMVLISPNCILIVSQTWNSATRRILLHAADTAVETLKDTTGIEYAGVVTNRIPVCFKSDIESFGGIVCRPFEIGLPFGTVASP